ncbi:MAG TPA: tetratricopeptide repeat protein [Actinomycetota bacterium]
MADAPTWSTGRTHRALLIGNARLGGAAERFGPLRSPPGDVAAVRAALTDADRGLHARRHVQVVIDAPKERVLAALRAFFDGAGPDDQLLLFYSGHGLADERGALHLGSSDTMAQFPVSTAVPAEVVGQLADASPAAAVAVVLDCRYGDAWPGSPSAGLAGPRRLVLASPPGVPRADDGERVSAFTEVLAAGLTAGAAADRNRDGLVSFAELCAFVTARLTRVGDPPPECWLPPAGADVPVARAGDPAKAPPSGAGPAERSEWRLPGEEAPLVPAGGAPAPQWAAEPPFPPSPVPVGAAPQPAAGRPERAGNPNGEPQDPLAASFAGPSATPTGDSGLPPSGAAWPDDLAEALEPGPVPSASASPRAFPSEILPPGPAAPDGPVSPALGPATEAPGPASRGPGHGRSRRDAVAPTEIHHPDPQPAGADARGPLTNLPLAGAQAPGAADLLMAEIRRRLERGERILTLVGRGAVGPASPMVRYAGRHAGEYQVCWWLRAHDPALLAEDWRSLASALGLPAHSDLLRAVPELRAWLENQRNGPWLLVLDGAPAPEEVAPYLPKSGRGQVLITATSPGWEELSSSAPLRMPTPRPWAASRSERPPSQPPTPERPASTQPPPAGPRGEPIRGEPLPPGRHLPPAEPANGRPAGGGPAGDGLDATGRQEILHWDQALKRLRRASPQAAALLQLAAFLDSEAIPVGLLAMTGVVLPGQLGASLRDPKAFRIALATLAQRGMVAHSGDRVAVPPLAQVAVGSALGAEGVRTWAAYALRVLGIVLALPASEGRRPAWAEPSHLLPHAEAAARHALALGVRTAELPTVLNEIGVHLLRMRRPDLAVPYLERALSLAREVHGLRHREVVRALDHLALAHRELGDQALAMRLRGEALAISRSLDRHLLHDRGRHPGPR